MLQTVSYVILISLWYNKYQAQSMKISNTYGEAHSWSFSLRESILCRSKEIDRLKRAHETNIRHTKKIFE